MSLIHSSPHGITVRTLTRVASHIRPEVWYFSPADESYLHVIEHKNISAEDSDGQTKIFHPVEILAIEYPD